MPRSPIPSSVSCGRAAALACLVALAHPSPARACSQDAPIRHNLTVGGTVVVALADPEEGRVVVIDGSEARVVTASREHFRNEVATFTSDGRTMILAREDWSNEDLGAGCMATFVHLERVDLSTGVRTPMRRLRSAGVSSLKLSATDRWMLVEASDSTGEPVVHLFDLSTGTRVRVTRDLRADFLDADTLLIEDLEGGLRIAQRSDGRVLARLPVAAEGEHLSFVPGHSSADAFTMLATRPSGGARLVDAARTGRRVRLRYTPLRFPGTIAATTSNGAQLLVIADRQVRVVERATLREIARVSGANRYTTAALAADGATLAVVSIRRPTRDEREGPYDISASFPTTIERFDLGSSARVAWGPTPRSTLRRPAAAETVVRPD